MAWIEEKKRSDGGLSASVHWRLGGTRSGGMQPETFGAGSDARNRARAEGFLQMVTAAGQNWPDGWVKGEGFVRTGDDVDPMVAPPTVAEVGEAYVRQIVDCSTGQRKRYRSCSLHRRFGGIPLGGRPSPSSLAGRSRPPAGVGVPAQNGLAEPSQHRDATFRLAEHHDPAGIFEDGKVELGARRREVRREAAWRGTSGG